MIYKISIDKKAQKFILKQQKNKQILIYKAIYNLPAGDTRPLEGHKELFRMYKSRGEKQVNHLQKMEKVTNLSLELQIEKR